MNRIIMLLEVHLRVIQVAVVFRRPARWWKKPGYVGICGGSGIAGSNGKVEGTRVLLT